MSGSWNPGRAWVVALLAVALLALGWPRGSGSVAPLPDCALHVEVHGDVELPGVVCLREPVAAAGAVLGPAGAADCEPPAGYAPSNGDRIVVRRGGGACRLEIARMSGAALLALGLPIDLNSASPEDLETLPGIGPVLAGRIAGYAREHPFADPEELTAVRGIGPKKLERVRKLVVAGR